MKGTTYENRSGKRKGAAIFLVLFLLMGTALWNIWGGSEPLQTSTLRVSFNRLSSIPVEFEIPQPGRLRINTGPSSLMKDARVFGLVMSSSQITPSNTEPFLVSSAYETFFNQSNPQDPSEFQLGVVFPEGQFTIEEGTLAELPFTTTQEGAFEIKSIYFGSLPALTFPPYQEFPVYVESPTIAFDENGAARIVTTTTQPPPVQNPACSDTLDNDGDGKIDFPQDLGCSSAADTDETDPPGPAPLRLDIPAQHLKSVQTIDYRTETIVILPPAQEQLQYQFTLKAMGGGGQYTFGVRGRSPNANDAYPLTDSGLILRSNGLITGEPDVLRAANYRYPLFVTDGDQTLNFSLQIAVHDAFGNPVGLVIETSFTGTEHYCTIGKVCEAFFKAQKGIEPYLYAFSGESPLTTQFLQVNAGQAFYRFTPTAEHVGVYNATVSVTDSSKATGTAQNVTASVPFTLTIEQPEIESSFKFSADPGCDFLDLSTADPSFSYFQFTCRNGVMEGSQGLVRAEDSLNRAEAAKITTLIVTEEEQVASTFSPFSNLSPSTPVNYNDVTVGDWYANFVYYLFRQGIIVDNLLYRPADTLNVAEALKLIIEAYAPLNDDLAIDLLDITDYDEWFEPYQMIASYVDAEMAYVDPSLPAKREWIAELLFKLYRSYPVNKFQ